MHKNVNIANLIQLCYYFFSALEVLDRLSYAIPLDNTNQATLTRTNVAVGAQQTTPESFTGITFNAKLANNIVGDVALTDGKQEDSAADISIPSSIFQDLSVPQSNTVRISFNFFVDDTLFQPQTKQDNQNSQTRIVIGTAIVSAGVEGIVVTGLTTPVSATFDRKPVSTTVPTKHCDDVIHCSRDNMTVNHLVFCTVYRHRGS